MLSAHSYIEQPTLILNNLYLQSTIVRDVSDMLLFWIEIERKLLLVMLLCRLLYKQRTPSYRLLLLAWCLIIIIISLADHILYSVCIVRIWIFIVATYCIGLFGRIFWSFLISRSSLSQKWVNIKHVYDFFLLK